MKIILIHYRYYDASGPETYLFNVTKMLTDKGHEVIPFSLDYAKNKKSDYSKYFPKPVIENFHFNKEGSAISLKNKISIIKNGFYNKNVYHFSNTVYLMIFFIPLLPGGGIFSTFNGILFWTIFSLVNLDYEESKKIL